MIHDSIFVLLNEKRSRDKQTGGQQESMQQTIII